MKRFGWLALLLILAMTIAACGGGATTETTVEEQPAATEEGAVVEEAPAEEATGPFRVAVVMPSAINDLAFSQSMFDALTAIQAEMGAENFEFVYSENMFVVEDAAAALRDYASQGYNLVIGHGSQYGSSLQEIAPDFPDTSFAWGTTVDTFGIPNIYAEVDAVYTNTAPVCPPATPWASSARSRRATPNCTWTASWPGPRRPSPTSPSTSTTSAPSATWPWRPRRPTLWSARARTP